MYVAPKSMLALLPLSLGAFQVIDLNDGSELFRYDPSQPRFALSALHLLEPTEAALGPNPSPSRLSRLASNLTAELLDDGDVVFSGIIEGIHLQARLKSRRGTIERVHIWEDLKNALNRNRYRSAEPFEAALARPRSRLPVAISSSGVVAAALDGALVLLSPNQK